MTPTSLPDLRGLTLAERILSVRSGSRVRAGELVVVSVDQVMVVDSVAPSVIARIENDLGGRVRNPERVTFVLDHVAPAANVEVATAQADARRYARERGIRIFDVGRGICHQVLMEEGLIQPGGVVLGSDSHSTTYGAVSCFGTGMGATDVALSAASGRTWLKVPETVVVKLTGERPVGVSAKDVALTVVRELTAEGATYSSLEFHGAEDFTLSERMTLANLAVEAGAKVGLVPPSGEVLEGFSVPEWLVVDPDAAYVRVLELNLGALTPVVAAPSSVDNVHPLSGFSGVRVDQVFVGTCTNGRLDDLHTVADILRGQRVADGTRLLVIPASSRVLQDAAADGTLTTLLAAGAVFGTPGCGPCMGRHMGVLAPSEVCVSTSNRNFVGRMGSSEAQIFLASPAVAALTALTGFLAAPQPEPVVA